MEEDITKLLLVGLTKAQFTAFFIWAMAGMLLSFAIGVGRGIKKTKEKWSWSKFWTGGWRVLGGLISVAAGIVFFEKAAGLMFQSEAPIQLTMWSAFTVVGLGSDRLGKLFSGYVQPKK